MAMAKSTVDGNDGLWTLLSSPEYTVANARDTRYPAMVAAIDRVRSAMTTTETSKLPLQSKGREIEITARICVSFTWRLLQAISPEAAFATRTHAHV